MFSLLHHTNTDLDQKRQQSIKYRGTVYFRTSSTGMKGIYCALIQSFKDVIIKTHHELLLCFLGTYVCYDGAQARVALPIQNPLFYSELRILSVAFCVCITFLSCPRVFFPRMADSI